MTVHEETSWASFTSIFKFLRERLAAVKDDAGVTGSEEGGGKDTSEATNEKCGKDDKEGSCVTEEEQVGGVKKMRKDT